jgi:hypothetical protein
MPQYGAIRDSFGKKAKPKPTPYNSYDAAVLQGGEDYDSIMAGYNSLRNTNPILANYNYFQSQGESDLINQLREQTQTGGYRPEDIANIRARGVSPIRSVYANAMRNASRATNLAGGYSPNAGAVQAKMARELSSTLADKSTDVEASIAELMARGKESATSQLAPLVTREGTYRAGIDEGNINEQRRIQTELPLEILRGKSSIYGTTPAMAALFGQQALALRGQDIQQQGMQIGQNQNRAGNALSLISNIGRRRRVGGKF